eukprot:CAMPEP_0184494710 /NCGR_PEP_ID=MMETSP0113_2-20130426/29405_1 /TAXON_ID=91329 /ORGANISM="Norrisiella sphaerica, Strain BC52" /LENGTH=306 /DNA_ID=CAMNT_0026880573 /DNA_START=269 /DNA_END=1189 /DNA_ORIENTATION=+
MVPFADEVDLKTLSDEKCIDLLLVDHNKLAVSQEFLAPCVIGVLDHHKDEKMYEDTCRFRRIETIGSTCSLIALQMLAEAPDLMTPEIATLLTSVILLDTSNLDPKVEKATPMDTKALAGLRKAGGVGADDYGKLYSKLMDMRMDISKLSSAQLLIKDTKYGIANGLHFAIASVPLRLETWVKRDAKGLDAFREFCQEENLDALVVMTSFQDSEGKFARQLAIIGPERSQGPAKALAKEMEMSAKLEVKRLELDWDKGVSGSKGPFFRAYNQGNVKSSRKQVMPLVNEILAKLDKSKGMFFTPVKF